RPRPFQREALHLLRIARIRENPCHEIARADRLVLRHPCPEMIVRLADRMTEFETQIAGTELHAVAEGDVRIDPRVRAEAARQRRRAILVAFAHAHAQFLRGRELARIDGEIIAIGEFVTTKAWAHILMADDLRARAVALARLANESTRAAHMVRMAMRVADMRHRLVGPFAERLQHPTAKGLKARIEKNKPVARTKGDDMGEGFHKRDAIRHFRQFRRRTVDQASAFINVVVDEAGGCCEKIGHDGAPFLIRERLAGREGSTMIFPRDSARRNCRVSAGLSAAAAVRAFWRSSCPARASRQSSSPASPQACPSPQNSAASASAWSAPRG